VFENIEAFRTELELLSKVDHPFVLRILETYENDRLAYIVTEYCSGGELMERFTKNK
jgi:serine/threonine protein kinase